MRRAKKQYKDRNTQPAEQTLQRFKEMLTSSEEGKRWCLRARCRFKTQHSARGSRCSMSALLLNGEGSSIVQIGAHQGRWH